MIYEKLKLVCIRKKKKQKKMVLLSERRKKNRQMIGFGCPNKAASVRGPRTLLHPWSCSKFACNDYICHGSLDPLNDDRYASIFLFSLEFYFFILFFVIHFRVCMFHLALNVDSLVQPTILQMVIQVVRQTTANASAAGRRAHGSTRT